MTHELVRTNVAAIEDLLIDRDDLANQVIELTGELESANAYIRTLETELRACREATTLPGWKLIFDDDFAVDVPLGAFPVPGGKWGAYPVGWLDTSKNGTYDPARTIGVRNGTMRIRMYTDPNGVTRVAAPVPYIRTPTATERWPGQIYGRYEYVARFGEGGAGFKVAWLLWPDKGANTSGSPSGIGGNGEIDWPEHILGQSIRTNGFMHRQDATVGNDQYACAVDADLRQWHTYTLEWSKDLCRFLFDGREIGRTTERVPYTAMHAVLQCETQLVGGKPAATAVADIEIDRVRIWSKA